MIKFWLIAAAALVLGWVTVALAQVSVDRYTWREGTEVQEQGASNTEKHLPYPGLVYSYTGKQETDNPNRFLDRYNQPHNGGSGVNSTGPVYNPYTIRW